MEKRNDEDSQVDVEEEMKGSDGPTSASWHKADESALSINHLRALLINGDLTYRQRDDMQYQKGYRFLYNKKNNVQKVATATYVPQCTTQRTSQDAMDQRTPRRWNMNRAKKAGRKGKVIQINKKKKKE